jgi:tetratricopeptide (TPR) repeat protein
MSGARDATDHCEVILIFNQEALTFLAALDDLDAVARFCESLATKVSRERSDVYFRLRGMAALSYHVMGLHERRDAHLVALRKLAAPPDGRQQAREHQEWYENVDLKYHDLLVLCEMADRAAVEAEQNGRLRAAAQIRTGQGRLRESIDLARRAREREWHLTMDEEGFELPSRPCEWNDHEWRELLCNPAHPQHQLGVVSFAWYVSALNAASNRDHAGVLYGLAVEAGLQEQVRRLAPWVREPNSPLFHPRVVAAARASQLDAQRGWAPWKARQYYTLLERVRTEMPPGERIELAARLATGQADPARCLGVVDTAERLLRAGRFPFTPDERRDPIEEFGALLTGLCEENGLPERAGEIHLAVLRQERYSLSRRQAVRCFIAAGRWGRAATTMAVWDARQQLKPSRRYRYGWVLRELGRTAEARAQLQRAVREAPFSYGRHVEQEMVCAGDLGEAWACWRARHRASPVSDQYTELAYHRQEYALAVTHRRSAVFHHLCGLQAISGETVFWAARALNVSTALARFQMGRAVDVEALVDRFLANYVGDVETAALLVNGLDALGHSAQADRAYAGAMACRRRQLELVPEKTASDCALIGLAAMCGRDLDEALRRALKLVENDPRNSRLLAVLSLVHVARGEPERADAAIHRALRWNTVFLDYDLVECRLSVPPVQWSRAGE